MIILCFVQINHLKWDGDRRGIGGIPQGGQGGLQPVQRSVLNRSCALENVLVGEREGGEGERGGRGREREGGEGEISLGHRLKANMADNRGPGG